MKIKKKHIVLGLIGVFGLSMMSFVSGKVSQAKAVFEKIEVKISTIKRIRIANSALKFDVDILFKILLHKTLQRLLVVF